LAQNKGVFSKISQIIVDGVNDLWRALSMTTLSTSAVSLNPSSRVADPGHFDWIRIHTLKNLVRIRPQSNIIPQWQCRPVVGSVNDAADFSWAVSVTLWIQLCNFVQKLRGIIDTVDQCASKFYMPGVGMHSQIIFLKSKR
jgi:hypothetical protein